MYTEVRSDYMFGPAVDSQSRDDGNLLAGITIDGWETDNPNEVGTVIAQVLMTTHHDIVVSWHDSGARVEPAVEEAVEDAKTRLKDQFGSAEYGEQSRLLHVTFRAADSEEIIRVDNWDEKFEIRLEEAYRLWLDGDDEFYSVISRELDRFGYKYEFLAYDSEILV